MCRLSTLDEQSRWLDIVEGKISKLNVFLMEAAHKAVLRGEKQEDRVGEKSSKYIRRTPLCCRNLM